MRWIKGIIAFLRSPALTVWIVGIFVFYYLTVAVWSKEAFGKFISYISSNNIARSLYLLFFLNLLLRVAEALWRKRRSLSAVLIRLPLYIGIVLFVFSSFMSVNFREQRWLLVGEGDMIHLPWEVGPMRVVKIDPALESSTLKMEGSLIFDYEPFVTIADTEGNIHRIGAFPPKRADSTYMHILNFGIAPGVELWQNGRLLRRGYMALRIIPFGTVDSFEISPYPYRFYIHILPNRILKKGKETAREYNINKPLYQVEILKGDKRVFTGSTSETLTFEGYTLRFFRPIYWVQLEVVHDPFYLWFILSLALLFVGVPVYLVGILL
jgi:hypothetical protein